MNLNWPIIGTAATLVIALILLAVLGVFGWRSWPGGPNAALALSAVVLIGLILIVALMALLVVVHWAISLTNATQALGLPEGSIRALLAFSLVLIFVCLSAFLYGGVNSPDIGSSGKSLTKITQKQLDELQSQFAVAYEPVRENGVLVREEGGILYNATYYTKRSKDADDFAKQIFTTLATVFVSVISFYFGSSATTAGIGAGAKAAQGPANPPVAANPVGPANPAGAPNPVGVGVNPAGPANPPGAANPPLVT